MPVATPMQNPEAVFPTLKHAVPIADSFDDAEGRLAYYSSFTTDDVNVSNQRHIDIRTFNQSDIMVNRQVLLFDSYLLTDLDAYTLSALDANVAIRRGEQWSDGTIAKQSDRNNLWGLSLPLVAGVNTTTSVIQPPLTKSLTGQTEIESVELINLKDTDVLSVSLPAYPNSVIDAANSFLDFTDTSDGSFPTGGFLSLPFNASTISLSAGNQELRFNRSQWDSISRITGVRFRITATASGTFRAMAIRVLDANWKFTDIDADTRLSLIRPSVPLNGSSRATATRAFTFPRLWRTDEISGVADPRPIDTKLAISFNTGNMTVATGGSPNRISLFARGVNYDEYNMSSLDLLTMGDLDGSAMPDYATDEYVVRQISELDRQTVGQLDLSVQADLERVVNSTFGSWLEARIAWSSASTSLKLLDQTGVGYTFTLPILVPNTDYSLIFELNDTTARLEVYPLTLTGLFDEAQRVFDTGWIVDGFLIKRRGGRVGWSASFVDGDVTLDSLQTMKTNFGEMRTKVFKSMTPVEGASLSYVGSTARQLFQGFDIGPFGGRIELDKRITLDDESYKIISDGSGSLQGVMSNPLEITDFGAIDGKFSIYYPSDAQGVQPLVYLIGDNERLIPIGINISKTNQWETFYLSNLSLDNLQSGSYRLAFFLPSLVPITYYLDDIRIEQRIVEWAARSVQSDPWGYTPAEWNYFRDITNKSSNGILFNRIGKCFQIKGRLLAQDASITNYTATPKYAELGRFVWPEDSISVDPPTADFTATTDGLAVTFVATGLSSTSRIVAYEWAFGDETFGTGESVIHTYLRNGTYAVTLTLMDAYGNRVSTNQSVSVF